MSTVAGQYAAVTDSVGKPLPQPHPRNPLDISSDDGLFAEERNRFDRPVEAQSHPI